MRIPASMLLGGLFFSPEGISTRINFLKPATIANTLTQALLLHNLGLSQNPDVMSRNHKHFQCNPQTSQAHQRWHLKSHMGFGFVSSVSKTDETRPNTKPKTDEIDFSSAFVLLHHSSYLTYSRCVMDIGAHVHLSLSECTVQQPRECSWHLPGSTGKEQDFSSCLQLFLILLDARQMLTMVTLGTHCSQNGVSWDRKHTATSRIPNKSPIIRAAQGCRLGLAGEVVHALLCEGWSTHRAHGDAKFGCWALTSLMYTLTNRFPSPPQ